eukprot:131127-Prorocentrum_minimum.AAC.3
MQRTSSCPSSEHRKGRYPIPKWRNGESEFQDSLVGIQPENMPPAPQSKHPTLYSLWLVLRVITCARGTATGTERNPAYKKASHPEEMKYVRKQTRSIMWVVSHRQYRYTPTNPSARMVTTAF